MKLLFKQRIFSWFDSYDIYDEHGNTVFTVQGRLSWGHKLEIFTQNGGYAGTVKEEVLRFLPHFSLYTQNGYIGSVQKKLTFFKPAFVLDMQGWHVEGDIWGWNYSVEDSSGMPVMQASKQLFQLSDTYVLDIPNPHNALLCLMVVLAIDAAKCSSE